MKRLLSLIFTSILALSLCGCFLLESHSSSEKIPTMFTDSEIVSVRYYYHESEGYRFEELDEDRLDEFVDELNSMEIDTGGARDYFWGGFVYVTNCEFWDVMKDYFPSIEENGDKFRG